MRATSPWALGVAGRPVSTPEEVDALVTDQEASGYPCPLSAHIRISHLSINPSGVYIIGRHTRLASFCTPTQSLACPQSTMLGQAFVGALLAAALATAAPGPAAADPCAAVAGQTFADPATVIACQKSFPFNETLRQNVMTVVSNVFNFYTFEEYYLKSPPPFQESTVNINQTLKKLSTEKFATDYDFNLALYNFTTQLNDGHTRWFPSCYNAYQNLLPAPIVILEENGEQGVYIIPDLADFLPLVGDAYISFLENKGFDWKRLAGAKVSKINDIDPFDYIDHIATTVSGNYLDHGIRVNSVLSSYRIVSNAYSQRFGDLAGPSIVTQTSLRMTLQTVNSTKTETVDIPFVASFAGVAFTDKASYWENNCAANSATNGVDLRAQGNVNGPLQTESGPRRIRGASFDLTAKKDVALPGPFVPVLPTTGGSEGVIKSYVLPGNKTGVMFVGSFSPDDFDGFQTDTKNAIDDILASGADQLIIDLTNNGGGFVCLGLFLHNYLAGANFGYPGFQSINRANALAQRILGNDIKLNTTDNLSFYTADNWAFPQNNTEEPASHNYMKPPVTITVNGAKETNSERFFDVCTPYSVDLPEAPPFDFKKIAIVGNANCASTCALFSSVLYERHGVKFGIFGGKPGESIQIKGMAGNQVLEWADLDTEIKTAELGNSPLIPPDLLVDGNMRVNWRSAYAWSDLSTPIAYVDEPAQLRFAYTKDTWNNPQNLWSFAESQFFS
ncbi:unnamed protein product [Peniophora sp. CBMAI 1063]|nr:unnamed protein product [Peniophora sp. CBMAI 1063]